MARLRARVERRFSDLDVLGHVNNVAYLVYLEEARVQLLRHLGGADAPLPSLVVARQEIDHLRPLLLRPAPLVVECWVESIGTTSFVLGYEVVDDDGSVAARARTVIVGFDPVAQAKAPLDPRVVAALDHLRDDRA